MCVHSAVFTKVAEFAIQSEKIYYRSWASNIKICLLINGCKSNIKEYKVI